MILTDKQELKIRIAIFKELKSLMRRGTTIEYLETKPEIFYSSQEMSRTLNNIIKLLKEN